MQFTLVCLVVLVASACAQVSMSPGYKEKYPQYYYLSKQARHPRDVSWDTKVGNNGKVFGNLGSNDQGLFGTGGYKQQIFDDDRGKLEGQAYGTRVIGPVDSSHLGGRLDWSNKDAQAALEVSKQIGGRTSVSAAAGGDWKLDKDTHLTASGTVSQDIGRGKPDVGVQAQIEHKW